MSHPGASPPSGMVRHTELLARKALHCIDGRRSVGVIGAPGGNLGEVVAVLAAAERALGPLDPIVVDAVMRRVVERYGRFYGHTDQHALERLGEATGLATDAPTMESLLRAAPPPQRDAILAALSTPAHVGCGHLSGSLAADHHADVRPELVHAALCAYHRRIWERHPNVILEVLHGEHHEDEVVVVRGESASLALQPDERGRSRFVHHVDAARWFRHKVAAVVSDLLTALDPVDLGLAADATAEHLAQHTTERLAAGRPVRFVGP